MRVGDQVTYIDERGKAAAATVVRVRGGHRCDLDVERMGLVQMVPYTPDVALMGGGDADAPPAARIGPPASPPIPRAPWALYLVAAGASALGGALGSLITYALLR